MAPRLRPLAASAVAGAAIVAILAHCGGVLLLGAEGPAAPKQAASAEKREATEASVEDPLGPNGACYVCHMTFVKEDLAKTHLANKIGCVKCHGVSAKHANDEDIGATKPDITFRRADVDASCQKCHEGHNVPARRVVARLIERNLSSRGAVICTDCHGTHKIDRSAAESDPPSRAGQPAPKAAR
jgi:hypothetical protein